MAFFNWFSRRSDDSRKPLANIAAQKANRGPVVAPASPPPSLPTRPPADLINRSEERKARRHMRREQLYSAIRKAMTHAGVLSASFKFKVLSLDQSGDQFLVMMDVHPSLGLQEEKLLESEALVIQTAKMQFEILVTAVYWRIDTKAEMGDLKHSGFESRPAPLAAIGQASGVKKSAASRFEPIDDDEVAAFKRALATSTLPSIPSQSQRSANVANAAKNRSIQPSYTLITGFEDTEMPESVAVPVLSTTQYGDLN